MSKPAIVLLFIYITYPALIFWQGFVHSANIDRTDIKPECLVERER